MMICLDNSSRSSTSNKKRWMTCWENKRKSSMRNKETWRNNSGLVISNSVFLTKLPYTGPPSHHRTQHYKVILYTFILKAIHEVGFSIISLGLMKRLPLSLKMYKNAYKLLFVHPVTSKKYQQLFGSIPFSLSVARRSSQWQWNTDTSPTTSCEKLCPPPPPQKKN